MHDEFGCTDDIGLDSRVELLLRNVCGRGSNYVESLATNDD